MAEVKYPDGGAPDVGDAVTSTSFFSSDIRKHEDLKNMLDSSKDGLKLEAMKRIIGMIAKGKDASDLFPAVVKNVVSKNMEVKKLVYVYLVRYAEEQQDLALLSISTFQRALRDPNQLIRASALRVLSSIRVPVIVPIMMLAIKDAVSDMSPYVRKTAAHAIPKLHSLDPEQKEQLMEVIDKLLADRTTLVVGSAVMAFEEVCPERIDLIHKNYRKLCNLLVDVEEWGQVEIILMLTRYARNQFVDPRNCGDDAVIDPDLRLLLRNCKPLLQSRNSAVVVAVAQLYYHVAPRSEVQLMVKSLIRLLRGHREIQSLVLSNIATVSTRQPGLFELYLKSFFVRSSDPTHIKLLKLEVLTNLATETNVPIVLREFQTYVASSDMELVAATIHSIGRCASRIREVADTCLNGLVSLLSNRNATVVAESVVVIKKLLQTQPTQRTDIISHMARLMDGMTVPMARASILWLLGEYAQHVPKIAPDVLRKVAKTFVEEEDIVKLQALNLASKLYLTNPKQTKLIAQYVFNLAKYDHNYDIRDRVRFLRQLVMGDSIISMHSTKFLLTSKPAPILQSKFENRDQYQMGSLSQFISARASEYRDLPEFPDTAPDPSVRNVEAPAVWEETRPVKKKPKSFYSSSPESSEESSESSDEETESSDSENSSSDDSSLSTEESDKESETNKKEALLLDLDDLTLVSGHTQASVPLQPTSQATTYCAAAVPAFVPLECQELLNKVAGKGLSLHFRYSRTPSMFSPRFTSLELTFCNHSSEELGDIHIPDTDSVKGVHLGITLAPGASSTTAIGLDFKESTQPVTLEVRIGDKATHSTSIKPPIGEILRPVIISAAAFAEHRGRLRGMNEHSCELSQLTDTVTEAVYRVANVLAVEPQDSNMFRYAGQTLSTGSLVLVTVTTGDKACLTINCDKMVIASMLLKELKEVLS
ncbi:AP-3 complex subunit beta-2-like [Ornithodoros turicata]